VQFCTRFCIIDMPVVNFKQNKAMINFENAFSYLQKDVKEEGEPVIIPGGVGKYDVLLSPTEHLSIGSVRDCFDYVEVKVKKGCTKAILIETMRKIVEEAQKPVRAKFEEEKIIIEPGAKIECRPGIVEWEGLIDKFKSRYSLEVLNSILTSEEAFEYPVREPAKKELSQILDRLHILNHKTNISFEESARLQERFNELLYAVGVMEGAKIDKEIKDRWIGGKVVHSR